MKEKILEKISLGISLLPLTFFIIRHLRIGMEAPWVYIFFAAYAVLIIVGFVFAICLIKNKKTRNAISKAALAISSVYLVFFSLFIYSTFPAQITEHCLNKYWLGCYPVVNFTFQYFCDIG